MKQPIIPPAFLWAAVLMAGLILFGCGSRQEKQPAIDQPGYPVNLVEARKRFHHLKLSLDQLQKDQELVQQKIGVAQRELQDLAQILPGLAVPGNLAGSATPGATGVMEPTKPAKEKKKKSSELRNPEEEKAKDSVMRTMAVVLFLAFAVVFLGKQWQDRGLTPPDTRDKAFDDPTAGAAGKKEDETPDEAEPSAVSGSAEVESPDQQAQENPEQSEFKPYFPGGDTPPSNQA